VPNTRADCVHLTDLPDPEVAPTSRGCQECLAEGREIWVHLRLCLTCGHVGCCDSSPYRHADAHFATTGHPVMRSFEPGETWRWCYLDRRLV
jgi:CPA1 family monovalent cation:H+ antiporter